MGIYLLFLVNALMLSLGIVWHKKQYARSPLIFFYYPALFAKLAAGLALGAIYVFYYKEGGDTLNFYQFGVYFGDLLINNPKLYYEMVVEERFPLSPEYGFLPDFSNQSRYFFLVKLFSLLSILCGKSYALMSFYCSLFSFMGLWHLAHRLSVYFPSYKLPVGGAFLFFPSVLLLGSGLSKEALALGCIAWLTAAGLDFFWQPRLRFTGFVLRYAFPVLPALYLLWQIKFYYLAALLPVLFTAGLVEKLPLPIVWKPGLLWGLLCIQSAGVLWLVPGFDAEGILLNIDLSYLQSFHFSDVQNCIRYFKPGTRGIVLHQYPEYLWLNAPIALFSAFYRPFIWEARSFFAYFAGLENLFLLLSTPPALWVLWRRTAGRYIVWIAAVLSYSGFLGTLLALGNPNFGTLIRLRIAFLPFLVFLLLAAFIELRSMYFEKKMGK